MVKYDPIITTPVLLRPFKFIQIFTRRLLTFLWAYWWLSVIVSITLVTTLVVVVNRNVENKSNENAQVSVVTPTPFPTFSPDEMPNSLGLVLLGHGGAGHSGGMLADVIQVVWLDFDKNQAALISIPRDLWIPGEPGYKANAGLAHGGSLAAGREQMQQIASAVTGLPIHYSVSVDFVGFQRLIGQALDGLEVKVQSTLDDPWYPIRGEELNPCDHSPEEIAQLSSQYSGFELEKQFACRYEHLHFEPGIHQMEGGDALKYVRSRHGSGAGDFSRSQRQHEVLLAIKNKLLSLKALDDIPDFVQSIAYTIDTNLDVKLLEKLTPSLKLLIDQKPKTIILSTENVFTSGNNSGQYALTTKQGGWESVHQYIKTQLATDSE